MGMALPVTPRVEAHILAAFLGYALWATLHQLHQGESKMSAIGDPGIDCAELSDDNRRALDRLERGRTHLFLTGKAGSGKSTLLKCFLQRTAKRVAVLAPTGIAALHLRGQTIHAFFGLPHTFLDPDTHAAIQHSARCAELLQHLDILIIDEVSMVRADLMDAIDASLQIHRGCPAPFGGVRMVLVGDLYQLPPVFRGTQEEKCLRARYDGAHFVYSRVFQGLGGIFRMWLHELGTGHRQKEDPTFQRLLDRVRTNRLDDTTLARLNTRVRKFSELSTPETYVILTTTNAGASRINGDYLDRLDSAPYQYEADVSDQFPREEDPTDRTLTLKKGARVILLKNDPDKRWVNGTLAVIERLGPRTIVIQTDTGSHSLARARWERITYEVDARKSISQRVVGVFEQYPLRLAWAITIHKSQGQSFSRVFIDFGHKTFEYGQAYVALSRCTSLEGLALKRSMTADDVKCDPHIASYERHFL